MIVIPDGNGLVETKATMTKNRNDHICEITSPKVCTLSNTHRTVVENKNDQNLKNRSGSKMN